MEHAAVTEVDEKTRSSPESSSAAEEESSALGYARLAGRISGTTTKCVLTLMILVAGWGFGRQVLRWWAPEDAAPPAAPSPAEWSSVLGDENRPHELRFGDGGGAIRRARMTGDRQQATRALRATCRELAAAVSPPAVAAGPRQQALLARLQGKRPVDRTDNGWEIHELDGVVPMVVATAPIEAKMPCAESPEVASPDRGVVSWGLALPADEQVWTLYTFAAGDGAGAASPTSTPTPLPDGCQMMVSVRAEDGAQVLSFSGPARPRQWEEHFDRWYRGRGWTSPRGWQREGETRRARLHNRDRDARVDIQFGPDGRGGMTGLLIFQAISNK